jgi:hypothetical protein
MISEHCRIMPFSQRERQAQNGSTAQENPVNAAECRADKESHMLTVDQPSDGRW